MQNAFRFRSAALAGLFTDTHTHTRTHTHTHTHPHTHTTRYKLWHPTRMCCTQPVRSPCDLVEITLGDAPAAAPRESAVGTQTVAAATNTESARVAGPWTVLANFLGRDVPTVPFPKLNTAAKGGFGGAKASKGGQQGPSAAELTRGRLDAYRAEQTESVRAVTEWPTVRRPHLYFEHTIFATHTSPPHVS